MSYFLFGTFSATCDKDTLQKVKAYGKEKNIYIWFNEEITFYEKIQRMLMEQKSRRILNLRLHRKINLAIVVMCSFLLINLPVKFYFQMNPEAFIKSVVGKT